MPMLSCMRATSAFEIIEIGFENGRYLGPSILLYRGIRNTVEAAVTSHTREIFRHGTSISRPALWKRPLALFPSRDCQHIIHENYCIN